MKTVNFNRADFVLSAADKKQFLRSSFPRVVFAGKSNVGKSSVINCILNRKNFAHVGSTPGKTVHVNYFMIDGKLYFIDLPGYGFADVSKAEKARWGSLMESFFAEQDFFSLGVMIVDARHKPTADDMNMVRWFRDSGKPFVIVANKLDKLKKSEISGCLSKITLTLNLGETDTLIPFSAEKGIGRDQLVRRILNC